MLEGGAGMGEQPDDVVLEELAALEQVSARLAEIPPARTASQEPIVRELERLRERLLSGDENKDLSALTEQYHNQSAILNQLRAAGQAVQVDAASPYFAHLRLEEEGRARDLFLGRTTCLEKGVRIVDWRDAPISKIFYSYRQGEEFDEEISGRERHGSVLARRMVRIRDGVLERVQAPEGDYRSIRQPWLAAGGLRVAAMAGGEAAASATTAPGIGSATRTRRGGRAAARRQTSARDHDLIDPPIRSDHAGCDGLPRGPRDRRVRRTRPSRSIASPPRLRGPRIDGPRPWYWSSPERSRATSPTSCLPSASTRCAS
ncbi:MAG: hypothetical protein R3E53_08725 [Myxococcota bacterium]